MALERPTNTRMSQDEGRAEETRRLGTLLASGARERRRAQIGSVRVTGPVRARVVTTSQRCGNVVRIRAVMLMERLHQDSHQRVDDHEEPGPPHPPTIMGTLSRSHGRNRSSMTNRFHDEPGRQFVSRLVGTG